MYPSLIARDLGPAVLSGILLALAFPKPDLSFTAWFALTPLLLSLHGKTLKKSFLIGFVSGLVFFFTTLYWIYHSLTYYGPIPFIVSVLLVFLLCCYLALYPAIFSLLYSYKMSNTNLPSMIVAPLIWTPLEYLRSYLLSGFPWVSVGYSQYKFLSFIQVADLIGVYGISFLILSFNGLIVDCLQIKKRRSERPLMPLYPTILSFCLLVLVYVGSFVYGYINLNYKGAGPLVRVAIIQANIEQDKKWDLKFQKQVMEIYKALTIQALGQNPELVVWPETALPFYFGTDRTLTEELIAFQESTGSYLLTGSMLIRNKKNSDSSKKQIYTNSAVLLDRDGKVSYIYDKIQLVPFGEYVPLRNILFFIKKLTYGLEDYTAGDSYIKALTPFGSFATVICYEIIFPGLVRKFFKNKGDFLVNITNDAWFGYTSGPYQHFSMAVFRAIENRKAVVRSANSGISGFIDSEGRIIASTPLFERAVLVADLKKDDRLSFYTKYGDIFTYIVTVSMIVLLLKKD